MSKLPTIRNVGIACLIAASVFTSCSKETSIENNPNGPNGGGGTAVAGKLNVSGAGTGTQIFPTPVTTNGTGTIGGNYDPATNTLVYTIQWANLTSVPTRMDFHGPATAGAQAGAVASITGFPSTTSGSVSGTTKLSDEQEAALLAGKWYYNIRTTNHVNGEVRGQINVN